MKQLFLASEINIVASSIASSIGKKRLKKLKTVFI